MGKRREGGGEKHRCTRKSTLEGQRNPGEAGATVRCLAEGSLNINNRKKDPRIDSNLRSDIFSLGVS